MQALAQRHLDSLFLLAQPGPVSAGGRLLDAGFLSSLHAADDFDRFRLGLVCKFNMMGDIKVCCLCKGLVHGASHLLASCSAVLLERRNFLSKIRRSWSDSLSAAADTDWSTSILSADIHLDVLNAVSKMVAKLRVPS